MPRILLIEDDDLLRNLLHNMLEILGHAVSEAPNGKEGLALFTKQGADLVLTDVVMPEMEGMQLIRELRRLDPAVRIIAMSGGGRQSAQDYLQVAQMLGAMRVLAKPFSKDALAATINKVMAESPPPAKDK